MTDKSIQENAYYEPGANRANRVRDLFDRIARRYDLINDVQSAGLHRWWKKRVITEAGQLEDTKALDICCGTGDLAFALAARGAQTTGFDFSSEMLFQARKKLRQSKRMTPPLCQISNKEMPRNYPLKRTHSMW